MRIQNSNTNGSAGILASDYPGSESGGHCQQLMDTLVSIGDSQQHLPHYLSTLAVADRSAASNATTKSKDIKSQSRKDRMLFPHWMHDNPYLSADFLPANRLTATVCPYFPISSRNSLKTPPLLPVENLPLNVQEKLIVQDLLACLQVCDSSFVIILLFF